MPDSEDLVREVAIDVRNAILSFCAVNSCIESTRLMILTLTELGFNVRPQAVKVAVMNKLSYQLLKSSIPHSRWPKEAWNLAVGFKEGDIPEDGWNGHLVAIVRTSGKPRHLLDISADQFDRPGKLSVPGPVGMYLTGVWTPQDPQIRVLNDNSTILEYYPFAPGDPVSRAYLDTPAWNNNPGDFERVAKGIADHYRNRMEKQNA